jgi:phage FluMu protein Com
VYKVNLVFPLHRILSTLSQAHHYLTPRPLTTPLSSTPYYYSSIFFTLRRRIHTYMVTCWLYLMRHKTITLCLNSFEVASRMNNFSAWVRRKLLEDQEFEAKIVTYYVYKCPLCKVINRFETRYARNCEQCAYPLKYERNYSEAIE